MRTDRMLRLLCGLVMCHAALGPAWAAAPGDRHGTRGFVFTTTNAAPDNELVALGRNRQGGLSVLGTLPTGGDGAGAGLGSQGAVILSDNGRVLYAVNAGSGTVSVFVIFPWGPALAQVVDSGGQQPISITRHDRLVYVLNADGAVGGNDHINGYVAGPRGFLAPLPGSARSLSAASVGPAQVGFSPDGATLVVTEKMTNLIDVFRVGRHGQVSTVTANPSSGMTPFGFAFDQHGRLIVSEAFGGAPDASAVSSYLLGRNGALRVLDPSVPTHQTAACWVALTRDSRFAYTTNTGSGTVSGFHVGRDGQLELLTPGGATASTGGPSTAPIDAAVVGNQFLYVLAAGTGQIGSFRVAQDGGLAPIQSVSGLPTSAVGLAAE